MSSILLTDDSWCELSSEAEGRDLTPVSFGQIPADMPMDVSAFLLRALGAERRAGSSKQWPMTLVRWESSYLRRNRKDEGSDGLLQHDSLNLLLHAALHRTCVRLELCTLSLLPPAMEGTLSLLDAEQPVWNPGAGSFPQGQQMSTANAQLQPHFSPACCQPLLRSLCVHPDCHTPIASLYSSSSLCSRCLLKVL